VDVKGEVEKHLRMQLDKSGVGLMKPNEIGMFFLFFFLHLAFCEVFSYFQLLLFCSFWAFRLHLSLSGFILMRDLHFYIVLIDLKYINLALAPGLEEKERADRIRKMAMVMKMC